MTAAKFECEPEICVEVFHRMRNSIILVWNVMPIFCRVFAITLNYDWMIVIKKLNELCEGAVVP
jgi:hypothetical protein